MQKLKERMETMEIDRQRYPKANNVSKEAEKYVEGEEVEST